MISSVGVIRLIVEPDDTGFHAFSPVLKGLYADGATVHEAAQNFIDAIPAYIESLVKHMADSVECRMTQRYVILWLKPGTNRHYTNSFVHYGAAEKRFYWLLDHNCSPVWVNGNEERVE